MTYISSQVQMTAWWKQTTKSKEPNILRKMAHKQCRKEKHGKRAFQLGYKIIWDFCIGSGRSHGGSLTINKKYASCHQDFISYYYFFNIS